MGKRLQSVINMAISEGYLKDYSNILGDLSNVEDKFKQMESFTLHMSTVGGDEENDYLDGLYEEYKNKGYE